MVPEGVTDEDWVRFLAAVGWAFVSMFIAFAVAGEGNLVYRDTSNDATLVLTWLAIAQCGWVVIAFARRGRRAASPGHGSGETAPRR